VCSSLFIVIVNLIADTKRDSFSELMPVLLNILIGVPQMLSNIQMILICVAVWCILRFFTSTLNDLLDGCSARSKPLPGTTGAWPPPPAPTQRQEGPTCRLEAPSARVWIPRGPGISLRHDNVGCFIDYY
jgi:hypothetical protein